MPAEGDDASFDDADDCTIIPLRRLTFERQRSGDDAIAIYRAEVDDEDAPGAPIYTVTVTLAAPRDADDTAELERFLGEMEAGFVLTAPLPEDPTEEQAEDERDPGTDLLFELDLAGLRALEGEFGVVGFLRTAVGQDLPGAASFAASQTLGVQAILSRGKRHWYASRDGVLRWATVRALRGSGYLGPGGRHVTQAAPGRTRARAVYVQGESSPFRYTICVGWILR